MSDQIILECDIGNTRCKWRTVLGAEVLQRGSFDHSTRCKEWPGLKSIQRIRLACVAGDDVVQGIVGQLEHLGVRCERAVATAWQGDISNAYSEPQRLGVDRWLALIAGFHRQQGAVLVLDAGSALTADLVDSAGRHLGGYIVPGARLMEASLIKDTGQVRFKPGDFSAGLAFGCSTAGAVQAGVLSAQLGSVMMAIDEASRRIGQEFAILLTGGNRQMIARHLPQEMVGRVEIVPELVLDGLRWVLP